MIHTLYAPKLLAQNDFYRKETHFCIASNGSCKVLGSKSSISMCLTIQGLLHLTGPQLKRKLQVDKDSSRISAKIIVKKKNVQRRKYINVEASLGIFFFISEASLSILHPGEKKLLVFRLFY